MTVKELYEYAKSKGKEDRNILIRINISGYLVDFTGINERDVYINAYNDVVIDPSYE